MFLAPDTLVRRGLTNASGAEIQMTISVKTKTKHPHHEVESACANDRTQFETRHVGYARVSTEVQDTGLQFDALRAAGCQIVFEDHGYSGNSRKRPGLENALSALRSGDTLIVWRLDRLGRSLPHLIELVDGLALRGVGFRSLMESFDAKSSTGRLVFHMMGALAEFERALIVERTRAGLAAAKARGTRLGRPPQHGDAVREAVLDSLWGGRCAKDVAKEHGVNLRTVYRIAKAGHSAGR